MSAHSRIIIAGTAIALSLASESAGQQTSSAARRAELLARAQLDSGNYRASSATFTDMLRVAETRQDSAASIFGRAFAEQQTIELDSVPRAVATRLIREYRRAEALDASRYRSAAQVNIAILYSASGQHDSSAMTYVRASNLNESRRGARLLEAAREFQRAGQRREALRAAQEAARDRSVAADAQALLVELYRDGGERTELVRLADTLQSPTAPLAQVNEALAEMLQDRAWSATSWGERCLIVLARNYAALDVGPTQFAATQRPALDRAARANEGTEIARAIDALLDAYRRRDSTEIYRRHPGDVWWKTPTSDDPRRATWSTTLRKLGDWYARARASRIAISFYESALGAPEIPVDQEWVDLEALPPLPALYATLPDTGALWDRLHKVEMLTSALFQGKSSMRPDNLRRLRLVRLTLGHLFAQQGRWDNQWRGAIYQLEESRRLAQRMASGGSRDDPYFPPEVYELLFAEYARRGCRSEALSVGEELRDEYARRSAIPDRDRIAARLTQLRTTQTQAPPERCRGAAVV